MDSINGSKQKGIWKNDKIISGVIDFDNKVEDNEEDWMPKENWINCNIEYNMLSFKLISYYIIKSVE